MPAEINRRCEAGETPADLAAEFGISTRTVRRWLTAAGRSEPQRPSADPTAVVAAYAAGEPVKVLASRFGIDDKTVLSMVRRAGQPMRRPRLTGAKRDRILRRHEVGTPVAVIAAEVGVNRATIYRVLARMEEPSSPGGSSTGPPRATEDDEKQHLREVPR